MATGILAHIAAGFADEERDSLLRQMDAYAAKLRVALRNALPAEYRPIWDGLTEAQQDGQVAEALRRIAKDEQQRIDDILTDARLSPVLRRQLIGPN